MDIPDYTIDTTGNPAATPDAVKRRRALADQLMKTGMDSSPAAGGPGGGWVTALNRGLAGALSGYQRGSADQAEQQGQAGYQQKLAQALQGGGNVSPQSMIQLAGDPWANPAQLSTMTHVADAQRAQANSDRDFGEKKREFGMSYGLQKQSADRAAYEFDNTPDQYVPNPRASEPGQPAYIDQYAAAKTGGAPLSRPITPEERAAYKIAPDAAVMMTPDGPKSIGGPQTNVTTNVDTKGPDKYDSVMAEGMAKAHGALANGVEDAQARARDLAAMQGAVDAIQKNGGTTGGPLQSQALELSKTINAGANALGLQPPVDEKGISDKEFLTKFNRQIAGQQAKGAVGSRVTNFEMANYLKANPGLEMSLTGNQRLIGIQSQIEQRNVAVGNAIRQHVAEAVGAGKKVNPADVQKIITDYDAAHHVQDPVTGQDLTQSYTLPEFQKGGTNSALSGQHDTNMTKIRRWDPDTGHIE